MYFLNCAMPTLHCRTSDGAVFMDGRDVLGKTYMTGVSLSSCLVEDRSLLSATNGCLSL